jgi:hypothetical protein
MSDDGSYVFFQSPVGLVAGALSDVRVTTGEEGVPVIAENVYKWRDGHVFLLSDGLGGCVGLVSSGRPAGESVFLDVRVSGDDVFFVTTDQLVPRDTDTQRDYYDARVCTADEPCIAASSTEPSACEGEACHGPASTPPVFGALASATFSGPGNLPVPTVKLVVKPLTRAQKLAKALKACRVKTNRHKRVVCERQARKRYGAKKHKSKAKSKRT